MAVGSALTGRPPARPMMFWIGVVSVMVDEVLRQVRILRTGRNDPDVAARTGGKGVTGEEEDAPLELRDLGYERAVPPAAGGEDRGLARFERVARLLGSQR